MAVTFTNKAAAEMRERLTKIAQELSEVKTSDTTKTETKNDQESIDDFLQNIDATESKSTRFNISNSLKWI